MDSFYLDQHGKKIRVSREQSNNRFIEAMDKRRVGDLALHIPASEFDVRISINTETHLPITEQALESSNWSQLEIERFKDRMDYEYDGFIKIDLTQVRQREQVRHELELELVNAGRALQDQMVSAKFLANIIDMARFATII